MKPTVIAAVLALTVVGPAAAQRTTPATPRTPFSFNGGFFNFVPGTGFVPMTNAANNGIAPLFNRSAIFGQANQGPLVFVPGTGFVPQNLAQPNQITPDSVFGSTFPQANAGPLIFVPGVGFQLDPSFQQNLGTGNINATAVPTAVSGTPAFTPGTGGGGGYYGNGYYGNGYYGNPYYGDNLSGNPYYGNFNGGYPAAGAGYAPGGGYQGGSPVIAVQVTPGSRSSARAEMPPSDQQQARLASAMERKMEDRPLTEGQIVKIGATGIQVRLTVDGETRLQTFPVDQVFFYRRDANTGEDRLATAATEPDRVHEGDRVMVPLNPDQPRQSVAGVRQETQTGSTPDRAGETAPSISVGVQNTTAEAQMKVLGSRQMTRARARRARRPAR